MKHFVATEWYSSEKISFVSSVFKKKFGFCLLLLFLRYNLVETIRDNTSRISTPESSRSSGNAITLFRTSPPGQSPPSFTIDSVERKSYTWKYLLDEKKSGKSAEEIVQPIAEKIQSGHEILIDGKFVNSENVERVLQALKNERKVLWLKKGHVVRFSENDDGDDSPDAIVEIEPLQTPRIVPNPNAATRDLLLKCLALLSLPTCFIIIVFTLYLLARQI